MDFLKQFQDKIKKIDQGDTVKIRPRVFHLSNVKLCRLVTIYNNRRKVVACGLTRYEAGILQRHVETKLRKTQEPDGTGKNLFEVTTITIEDEN
jgi:hypothetical protein